MGEIWRLLGRLGQLARPIDLISSRVSYVDSLVGFVIVIFGCNQSYLNCTQKWKRENTNNPSKLLFFHKS